MFTARPVKSYRSNATFRGRSVEDIGLQVDWRPVVDSSWSNSSLDNLRRLMISVQHKVA